MINLDKNYLNHNFEFVLDFSGTFSDIYICNKCNTKVKMRLADDLSDYNPTVILPNNLGGSLNKIILLGDILTQTCDEMIIKGVIE
jgi:hypothetical protein